MVRQVGWLAPPATRHGVRAGLIRRGWRSANQMGTTHVAPDHTPTHLTRVSKQKGNRAMTYVFFMNRKLDGTLGEKLGSDGYFRPDQRWGYERIKSEARAHAKRLRAVAPDIEAFTICAGASIATARRVAGPFGV